MFGLSSVDTVCLCKRSGQDYVCTDAGIGEKTDFGELKDIFVGEKGAAASAADSIRQNSQLPWLVAFPGGGHDRDANEAWTEVLLDWIQELTKHRSVEKAYLPTPLEIQQMGHYMLLERIGQMAGSIIAQELEDMAGEALKNNKTAKGLNSLPRIELWLLVQSAGHDRASVNDEREELLRQALAHFVGEKETQEGAAAAGSSSVYLCVRFQGLKLHGTEVSGLETSWHRSFRA